jgi:hypothetical protein
MTPDDHKAIARRFFEEVWNQQKLEAIDEIFAPTVVFNGQPVSRDTFRSWLPDAPPFLTSGSRWRIRSLTGTRFQRDERGRGRIRDRIEALPQQVGGSSGARSALWRIVEGRIVEDWAVADELSILQQRGQFTG